MEGEDEEFEKLLGEIPQAMESPAQLEGFDPTEKAATSLADEPNSENVDSFHGLFQNFHPIPDFEERMEECTRPVSSAGNAKINPLMSLDPSHPFQHEEDSCVYVLNQSNRIAFTTPTDAALVTAFANLELKVSAPAAECISSAVGKLGHAEVFGQAFSASSSKPIALYNEVGSSLGNTLSSMTNEVGSTWLSHGSTYQPPASSFSSVSSAQLSLHAINSPVSYSLRGDETFPNSRGSSSVTFANADNLLSDVSMGGMYAHAYANSRGLEYGGTLHSHGNGGNNFPDFCRLGLAPDIDLHHQGHRTQTMQKQPGKPRHPVVCGGQVEGMDSFPFNGKESWQHNSEMALYLQAQELHKIQLLRQVREEERMHRIEQALLHWSGPAGCLQECVDSKNNSNRSSFHIGRDHDFCPPNVGGMFSPSDFRYRLQQQLNNPHVDGFCTFCKHGVCSRGNDSSVFHSKPKGAARNKAFQANSATFENFLSSGMALHDEKPPVRILSRKSSRVAAPSSSPLMGWWLNDNSMCERRESKGCLHPSAALSSAPLESVTRPILDPLKGGLYQLTDEMQPASAYSSLAEIEGRILSVAKDQNGCRFLQRKFDEGTIEDVQKIFSEIIHHAVELMVDPFGNYLIQKLLEVCTDDQRMDLLKSMTSSGELINVSLNMHGTRAVQKLVETLSSSQQVSIVTASLRSGVVTLIKDLNGNHVIQRCLQHLSNEDNQFIFEAAAYNCVEIATHRHGCCVLQRCIDHSKGVSRQHLIREIALNSLQLAQDSFGNYVVQYVLELGLSWAMEEVVDRLAENYAHLSMQKFSSNVVEKCLKLAGEEGRVRIVQELIDSSHLLQLLQDPYANYVIQSALMVSKGALRTSLVEAIRPHVPSLRSSPYGKRILSRRSLKKF